MQDNTRTRFSASAMPRLEACPSSIAKIAEVDAFLDATGGREMVYTEAALGDTAHEILSQLPYQSKAHGLGTPYNTYKALKAITESDTYRQSVDSGMFWFIYRAARRRDEMLDFCVSAAPGRVESIDVELDTQRLFTTIETAGQGNEPFSGLGDVVVKIESHEGGKRHLTGAILDYKSGWTAHEGRSNRQLTALAHLLKANNPELETVHTGLITRDNINREAEVFTYDAPLLERAEKVVRGIVGASVHILDGYEASRDSEGTPSPEMEARIEDSSAVSDHCAYCGGKAACMKLQQSLEAAYAAEMENIEMMPAADVMALAGRIIAADGSKGVRMPKDLKPLVIASVEARYAGIEGEEASGAKAAVKKFKATDLTRFLNEHYTPESVLEIFDMNKDTLFAAMKRVRDLDAQHNLLDKLKRETENLARAYLEKQEMEGMALEPGAARVSLKAGEQGIDPSPYEVFRSLSDAIPTVGAEDFISATASCSATMIRSFLAEMMGVNESGVVEELDKRLGHENPLFMKEGNPRIVLCETEEAAVKI